MMRRRGLGTTAEGRPPDGQLSILTDFVKAMGEEIIERHNAEQADS